MGQVTSRDGTQISYEVTGSGPALILVGGGLDDGSENAPLAAELASRFTVYNFARRGRGGSGDTSPYAVEREIEDIGALVGEAGGTAHLYGVSTGGALALESAAAGIAVDRLAVYEVPYNTSDAWPPRGRAYVEQLGAVLAAGDRSRALELFMEVTGSSQAEIEGAKRSPFWPPMEAIAHTLPYDAACLGNGQPPADRLARITQPALVATGTSAERPGAAEWVVALGPAADAIAAHIPNATRRTFAGQDHVADPAVVGPILTRFFTH